MRHSKIVTSINGHRLLPTARYAVSPDKTANTATPARLSLMNMIIRVIFNKIAAKKVPNENQSMDLDPILAISNDSKANERPIANIV